MACWSASPHSPIAVRDRGRGERREARPMSPSRERLGDEDGGHRRALLDAPPSSSGRRASARPSSFAWASSSSGAAQAGSASRAAGRSFVQREVADRLAQHLLLVVGRRGRRARRRTRFAWRAGRSSFFCGGERPPGGAGGAEAVLGGRGRARRSARSRTPTRSSSSSPARRLRARRPRPMPLSAAFIEGSRGRTAGCGGNSYRSVAIRMRTISQWIASGRRWPAANSIQIRQSSTSGGMPCRARAFYRCCS